MYSSSRQKAIWAEARVNTEHLSFQAKLSLGCPSWTPAQRHRVAQEMLAEKQNISRVSTCRLSPVWDRHPPDLVFRFVLRAPHTEDKKQIVWTARDTLSLLWGWNIQQELSGEWVWKTASWRASYCCCWCWCMMIEMGLIGGVISADECTRQRLSITQIVQWSEEKCTHQKLHSHWDFFWSIAVICLNVQSYLESILMNFQAGITFMLK